MSVARRVIAAVASAVLGLGPACCAAGSWADDLRSPVAAVRVRAAVSLGRLADRAAVPALIEALGDSEKDVRREAAKALGAIKDARAVTRLLETLRDRDPNVRLYAAYALGEIKDPKTVGVLLDAIRDPEWCVRDQAAWALREIRDPKIVEPLAAALKERDADVAHIEWLLRHVGGPEVAGRIAGLLAEPDAETRLRAVKVLVGLQDGAAVEPLLVALRDASEAVRRTACDGLFKFPDERAEKPLTDLMARERSPAVRAAAEKALGRITRRDELAAHWSFDDRDPKIARDVTGRGNDGQIRGASPVEGKVGFALQFGKGKYVALGRPAGLPIAERPFTVMAWARSDASDGVVVARGGAFCGFSLYVKDGVARFGIHREKEGPSYLAVGKEKVVGTWVHLAGVVRSDRIELYVNGKLSATARTDGYLPGNCGQGMEIGCDDGTSAAEITDAFQGILDEVKMVEAALSEKEIARECR